MIIENKKILITGQKGIAERLCHHLGQHNVVTCIGRDIDANRVKEWGETFLDFDIVINNAYDQWCQIAVLEYFFSRWRLQRDRMIVNIGSMVADYCRVVRSHDADYWPYRLHKQALQSAFQKMCQNASCDIKLINPGPTATDMTHTLDCVKMSTDDLAQKIIWCMEQPEIRRIDLWK
jgi:hypothetical protein